VSDQRISDPGAELAPGRILAQTREELGITQREVSDALNLAVSTVAAIEAGDQSRLPPYVFTRGYVRAYAKLLELDPEPLVAALANEPPEHKGTASGTVGEEGGATSPYLPPGLDLHHLLKPRNLAVIGGVVLILVVLVAVLMGGDEAVDSHADTADATPPVEQPPQTGADDVSETDGFPAESAQPERDDALETVVIEEMMAPAVVADPASLPQRDETAQRLTATGDNRLSLSFTEDCWVEIKDAADKTLFGDLGRAGQEIEFVGAGPFRVLLGYAPGVTLKFDGEPIALAPHTRNNVASLVLGQ
jgi:cytoskeleton protein RodZ